MRAGVRWVRLGRFSRITAVVLAAVMIASAGTAVPASGASGAGWKLGPGQKDTSIPVSPVLSKASEVVPARTAPTPVPVWPAAAEVDVALPESAEDAGQYRASGTPVRVARANPGGQQEKTAQLGKGAPKVKVRVSDQKAADALGLHGVVFSVTDLSGAVGPVRVGLDYGSFATAIGGGWADRLQLAELPACALTTPEKPLCRKGTPLTAAENNRKAQQIAGEVTFSAQAGITSQDRQVRVLAATAASSGSAGTPTAQPLSPAGSWSSGGSSGGFSYGYPFTVPNAPNGAAPSLALSYSSSSVDGLTSATNNQTSWVGDGWDFTPGGYVERHYVPCSEDLGGNNGQTKTGDQCWGVDNATLVLGGRSTELIKVSETVWRPKNDDGSKVELLTGGANPASHGQYWKVTTGDGTQYFLGRNQLPGWTAGKPETQSVWTVPVFGNNDGEDCFKANNFAGSWCQQAWRWNLDYMVDPHGNASSYYYQPETNSYGLNLNVTSAGTSYTAGGYPLRVEYGLRSVGGSVYGSAPTNQVTFDTAERCLPSGAITCAPAQLSSSTAGSWPDTPFDQICAAGATCDYGSPAFFTRKRLTAVHSQSFKAGAPADIDVWNLVHEFPGTGDASPSALWLASITHTGKSGGGSITLPPTTFGGFDFANRVDTAGDKYSPLTRYRLNEVRTETGGRIGVAYSAPDCLAGTRMPASPETDTMRCYASYWSPPSAHDPVLDWFHKYVVTDVSEEDLTGGSLAIKTHYDYLGDAAWHYDEGQFTKEDKKTWGQWRGYGVVRTSIGAPTATQTVTETLYLRGMDGDHLPGGVRQVSVPDSDGGSIVDQNPLQGFSRETRTYLPGSTKVDASSINEPWLRGPTATSSDGVLKAYMIDVATTRGRTLLPDGTSYRRTQVNKTFNDNGLVTDQEDQGDKADGSDDTCTRTTYVPNATTGMFDRSSEVSMFAGTCAGQASAANSITDVRVSYDKQAFGAAPTFGDITETGTLDSWDAAGQHFVPTSKNEYDAYGREVISTDVFGSVTRTAFVPPTGPVTGTTTTNPYGWVSSTTIEPERGNPTSSVDPNGVRTDVTYDALGRKTAVWNPGRSKVDNDKATATFEYAESRTAPTYVLTKTLQDNDLYTGSYAIYDGLGRSRQTQVPAQGGGRIITDTQYDTRGLQFKTSGGYFNADSGPSGVLVTAADNTLLNQTVTEYDDKARATASILMSKGVVQWKTSTIYSGDRTTTIPPAGGSPQTVVTDVQGQVVQRLQYTNGYTSGAANPADVTSYSYNAAGAMTSMSDSSGNVWSTGYDLRGRKIWQSDPDAGRSTFSYDKGGQLTSTTDGQGRTLVYSYDKLGRKTQENAGSATGPKLASWDYDTLTYGLGLPTSSTRWDGTNAYVNKVVAYDKYSRPLKTAVDIPASEGALQGSYQFSTKYTATGATAETVSPKAGNLLAEHVVHTYTDLGLPATTYAIDSQGKITDLVSLTDYTSYNELSRLQLDGATSSSNVGLTQTYDEVTRRPLTTSVRRATQVGDQLTNRTYTYDPAGNVKKIADTPSGSAADVQCFDYDYLQRMTDAWTPSSKDCATAKSSGALGGAAPYWKSYSFDKTGNRKQQVDHKATGDVTDTYTYPASGAASVKPHTLQKVDTAGPNGTSTSGYTYDETGSMLTRNVGGNTQTFTYDAEGRTATASENAGTSKYVYDADGNRLITRDPTGATLAIGDLELFQTAGTTGVTAIRYYEHGGGQVAERAGSAGLKWMLGDLHGTNGLSITSGSLIPTQRYQDPFGNARGAATTWPDKHGFVGGYQDTTGLTRLGARDYDPATGRFTSVDPVLDPGSPQALNGYAYANNAPATLSDPSGLSACFQMGEDGLFCHEGTQQAAMCANHCNVSYNHVVSPRTASAGQTAEKQYATARGLNETALRDAQVTVKKSKWDVFVDAAGELIKGLIGWDDIKGCVQDGAFGACLRTAINFIPWGKILKAGEIIADFWKGAKALITFGKEVEKAEKVIVDSERILVDARRAGAEAQRIAAEGESAAANAARDAKSSGASESSGGGAPACHSFVAGTQVALADGSSKPIEQMQTGDVVESTDPATGQVESHKVVATIVHGDESERTEITVDAEGVSGTVIATDWHPVWVEEAGGFVDIGAVEVGDHLHSPDGPAPVVTAVRHFTQSAAVYDLTVDRVHTYYVQAGATPVLVHNCGTGEISDEVMNKHILPGHSLELDNAHPEFMDKTKFAEGVTSTRIRQWAKDAMKAPMDKISTSNGAHRHLYDTGEEVGFYGETYVAAWVRNGVVSTVHPEVP
ncbi:MAG: hypothetical protein QOI21_4086 [Actinomycetota bacterium]|jgi:RHS repeat-associated protein|nr:hypothetical protein [Actinomycetota bacterium]